MFNFFQEGKFTMGSLQVAGKCIGSGGGLRIPEKSRKQAGRLAASVFASAGIRGPGNYLVYIVTAAKSVL